MANIITTLALEMSENWYVTKKLNSIGRVGENTVTKLIIEPTEILDNVTYELEIMSADGSKNVAELAIDGTELYLILTANMLTTSGITKMQVRGLFTDGSIKKSNIFELKVNRSISATEAYEEYAVIIFDQLVQDCRDIIEGAESYAVRAETAAVNAEAYSESASASATSASNSATTASTSATTAVNAATSAETSATTAHTSAETATTAAASASASATTATSASETAQTAASTATTASTTAVNASNTATSAASNAETAANSASTSANNASASATAASTSASNAATSETNASNSATAAATSETSAANSATSASTSATNAANSATAAATSASNAAVSATNASTSETNASTSATEAAEAAESVSASVAQINENTYRINDLEAIIGGYQLTDLPTGEMASIANGTALLMPSLKVGIEPVQEGSGDPSPENIRPITGWTAANVRVSGKNLIDESDRLISPSTSGASITYAKTSGIILKAGNSYTFSITGNTLPPNGIYFRKFADDSSVVVAYNKDNVTATITEDIVVYMLVLYNQGQTQDAWQNIKAQVELGSTATTYEPYNGATYTIQFRDGDNPLTVYGGTLDVTTGELVVDRVSVDLGSLTWSNLDNSNGVYRYRAMINNMKTKDIRSMAIVCSRYKTNIGGEPYSVGTIYNMPSPNSLVVASSSYSSIAEFINSLSGQTAVYELAEPTTYHLTPTQIRTLVGNNNIWADTGDIIEGKYYRSPF